MLLLVHGLGAAPAQEPLSWSNSAPYVRLDDPEQVVFMPKEAALVAQRHLKNVPPERWGMTLNTFEVPGRNLRVVKLFVDGGKVEVNFLVTRQSWSLLNDQNVARLNQVMEQLGRDLVQSGFAQEDQRGYLSWLDFVVLGMSMPLDEEFVRDYFTGDTRRAMWLDGQEKSADALLRYCHNVFVTREGGMVSFTYNSLLRNGSVVQHTVHARVAGGQLELLLLETAELRRAGTFSYPNLI